jgi:formylglycine-generating enzyme required for sulfatase activity
MSRRVRTGLPEVLLGLLGLFGCTETQESPGTSEATPSRDRGRLVIELPAGLAVGLDTQEPVPLPVEALEVTPGSHTLVLTSACQRVELVVDVAGGETLVVDRERAQGLAWATLQVTAQDREGKPQLHAVMLGDVVVGGGHGASTTMVPACPHHVRVAHDGPELLGGVVEDIDFGEEREVVRTVVLAPGPEMVRLPGGRFTLGPPEALKERWMEEEGRLIFSQYPVEVAAFEIDQTEVTAAQWMACRKAGGCARNRELWFTTGLPDDADRPNCNVDTGMPVAVGTPGRENHPMNCVARWEAEDYCRWAGKRLPTAIEWEYAARSGDDRTLWPWGIEDPRCEHGRGQFGPGCTNRGTSSVCSYSTGNTKQGICDIVGNVEEYVDDEPKDRPPTPPGEDPWMSPLCMGTSWSSTGSEVFRGATCGRSHRQESQIGFRCARTVTQP